MKSIFRALSVVAVFALGCSSESSTGPGDPASAQFAKTCAMSVRLADTDGKVDAEPIIEPTHVAKIEPTGERNDGHRAVMVTLTPLGERRMQTHTRSKVGHSAVVYCADREVFRARIMEPLGNSFVVNLPDTPTN